MTTELNKPVKRAGLRQSKTRKEYLLPLGHVYSLAVKHEVARAKAERVKAKKKMIDLTPLLHKDFS